MATDWVLISPHTFEKKDGGAVTVLNFVHKTSDIFGPHSVLHCGDRQAALRFPTRRLAISYRDKIGRKTLRAMRIAA